MAIEHIRKWTVGGVEIWRIVELNDHRDPFAILLDGCTPEQALSYDWLAPHFVTPDGQMRISFQAFVIRAGDRRIMVDTCIGNDRERQYGVFTHMQTSFLADIASVGCPAESIDTVLCTHLHFDHTGWNTKLVDGRWVPTFPNARYLFGRAEWEDLQHHLPEGGGHYVGHLPDSIQPVIDAGLVDFVDSHHRVTDEISLIPTPGHTAGHVSVKIQSRGQSAVITGDLMHHPIQCAVPEHLGNFDAARERAAQTRVKFLGDTEGGETLVIGSHFVDPTAGYVSRTGSASWRFDTEKPK
jgi:glyoxylase-like metal-dependent hydrolase (beta-lactamase superfamily II)